MNVPYLPVLARIHEIPICAAAAAAVMKRGKTKALPEGADTASKDSVAATPNNCVADSFSMCFARVCPVCSSVDKQTYTLTHIHAHTDVHNTHTHSCDCHPTTTIFPSTSLVRMSRAVAVHVHIVREE